MDPNSVASAIPDSPVEILAMVIPIVAIVLGLGVATLKLWLDFRKKREILQSHHAERMAAIEKGIELPPLPPQFYESNGSSLSADVVNAQLKGGQMTGLRYLRSGLVWLLVGIAISLALYADHDHSHHAAWWGGVPIAYGLSKLLFYFIANRTNAGADAPADQNKPKE